LVLTLFFPFLSFYHYSPLLLFSFTIIFTFMQCEIEAPVSYDVTRNTYFLASKMLSFRDVRGFWVNRRTACGAVWDRALILSSHKCNWKCVSCKHCPSQMTVSVSEWVSALGLPLSSSISQLEC
jgi:hypothetical protein